MTTTWKADPTHSELFFKVKHLMISEITGSVTGFNLDVQTEGNDFGNVNELKFDADLESLSTNNQSRDVHLRSAAFFDVENFQFLTFEGVKFEKMGMEPRTILSGLRNDYRLEGKLTIKGTTRQVTLQGEFGGTAVDVCGQKKAGFTVRGKISRKDFGLDWEGKTDAGKLIIGDEVRIFGNIQLVKQA